MLARAIELVATAPRRGGRRGGAHLCERVGQAPDFYAFLRAMEASRNFARKSTTMVLPADSPLFGVLFDSNYFNGGAPGSDAATEGEPPKRVAADTATMEEARMK